MRIGIDARLWNETGVGRYIRNLVWALQKLDTKNDYVLFVQSGFIVKNLRIKKSSFSIIETDIHWHALAEQTKFPQILYKEKLDLMHFPYFSVPILYKRPFIVTIHDLIIYHYSTGKASTLPLPLYQVKRFGYKKVLNYAVTHAKKIIVPLQAVKDDVVKHFPVSKENICVTYEGVDAEISVKLSGKVQQQKYFLYVGNAYPHKNLEKLVMGFAQYKTQTGDKETKLLLVGKEDYFYKRLHRFVEENAILDVDFLHTVTDAELSALYTHAIAFVSASLMEGFGLPSLEAMAHECLVLVADIPAFREVCQGNAVYFDPNKTDAIAECLKEIARHDKKMYKQQLANAKNRVNDFSWEKMAKQTLELYMQAV